MCVVRTEKHSWSEGRHPPTTNFKKSICSAIAFRKNRHSPSKRVTCLKQYPYPEIYHYFCSLHGTNLYNFYRIQVFSWMCRVICSLADESVPNGRRFLTQSTRRILQSDAKEIVNIARYQITNTHMFVRSTQR